jgi:hypothetical protein
MAHCGQRVRFVATWQRIFRGALKPFLFQRGHSDRGQARAKSLKFGERFKHIIELLNLYAGNGNAFSRSDLD